MLRTCMVRLAKNVTPVLTNNTRRAFVTSAVARKKDSFDKLFKEAESQKIQGAHPVGVTTEKGVITEDPGLTELELEETITKKYVEFFENVENDGWLARNAMNDLMSHAFVPEPEVTIAVMHSCRRMNDYALAMRYLESLKHLLHKEVNNIWPWYHQEIKATLQELGIETPEEIGFDKPEYFLPNVDDIHGYPKDGWKEAHAEWEAEIEKLKAKTLKLRAGFDSYIKARKSKGPEAEKAPEALRKLFE